MKRVLTALFALFLLIVVTACGDSANTATTVGSESQPVATTIAERTIEIIPHDRTLFCKEKMQLAASVQLSGDDITSESVIVWTSSDPAVATVDDMGNVQGISAGNVRITASLADDAIQASTDIIVGWHVAAVSLSQTELTLLTGSEKAAAKLEVQILPDGALYQEVLFVSSDESIVSVDAEGTLHAISPGTAVVTATSSDGSISESASCNVIVKQGVSSISFLEEPNTIYIGEKYKFTAEILPEDAESRSVIWSSSDENVATISQNGTITAVGAGHTEITCSAQDGSNVSAICTLDVVVGVQKMTMSENSATLLLGASEELNQRQLTCTVLPENTSFKGVSWTSSDESVAIVDEKGTVRGRAPGNAIISAHTADPRSTEKIKAICSITVGNAVTEIQISGGESVLAKGTSKKLSAVIMPESVHNPKVTWSSSNNNVLTVDANGNIRAVGVGGATISCTATDGSGVCTNKAFTVYQAVTSLTAVEKGEIFLFEGKSTSLHATAAPSDATNKKVTWSSDNQFIASVNSSGQVTGRRAGTVKITATTTDGSKKTCTFSIRVEPAVPVTVDSLGFGIYNANLLGITVKNNCSRKVIKNFDFDIALYSFDGKKITSSGSYSLGNDVTIGAGQTQTIKRTLSGVAWSQKVVITITGVKFSDNTYYSIPLSERETWSFSR